MSSMRRDHPDDDPAYGAQGAYGDHEDERRAYARGAAHDRFGGVNIGAAFFGWMVAVGMTVLLTGIVGAVFAVLDETGTSVDDVRGGADLSTVGIVGAIGLLVVLLIAYYSGGYVAGRMSRFDGGRQGLAVWVLALLFSLLAGLLGYLAGERYDVVSRVNVPSLDVTTSDLTTAGVVSLAVVLVGTLVVAIAGGKVGRRYHAKVDRAL